MNQSLAEFNSAMQGYIQKWATRWYYKIGKKIAKPIIQIETGYEKSRG